MTVVAWMAVLGAGIAAWLAMPPDPMARLRQVTWRLPGWAKAAPGAIDSKRRWWIGGAAAAAVVVYGYSITPLVLVLGPVVAVGTWVGLGRLEPSRLRVERLQLLHALPQALDLCQASVAAGQPLRSAVETVARALGPPVAPVFDRVTSAISVGLSEEQAWRVLADDPVIGGVARDLARSAAMGTPMSAVLSDHSAGLRRRSRTERLAAAKAVGVKAVLPLGLCYLPAFILTGVVPVIAGGIGRILG